MTPARPGGPMPAAVLWDMDGTLVDTEPYWFAAERELVESFGNEWSDDDAHAMVGFDLYDSAEYLREHGGVDLTNDEIVNHLLDGVIARVREHLPWRPGAQELLAELNDAGVPCGLVTMSWRRLVDEVLDATPHGSFTVSVAGDEVPVGSGKPHPTPYLLGAAALDVDPNDCLAIEDSPTGTRSALAAGCRVLGVAHVKPLDPSPGLVRCSSLDGLGTDEISQIFDQADASAVSATSTPTTSTRGLTTPSAARSTAADARRRTLLGIAAVLLLLVGGIAWWFRERAPAIPPGAVPIDAWTPHWALDEVMPDIDSRVNHLRDLSPFWFGAHAANDIHTDQYVPPELSQQFIERVGRSYARLIPSVKDEMPAGGMAAVLANPQTRTQHVDTIVAFVDSLNADGVDLDYEKFAFSDGRATWEQTRPNWVAFITELAQRLHAKGKTLTVSIPPVYDEKKTGERGYWVYDPGAIAPHVDSIRIMAYDFSPNTPGPISPIDWVHQSVDGLNAAVDKQYRHKLVLGVPVYGSNWVASTQGVCPAEAAGNETVTSRNIAGLIQKRGGAPTYDEVNSEWSYEYDLTITDNVVSCTQHRIVRWVDSEGAAERVEIARRAGWGGVALWALGYDDDEAWTAFLNASRVDLPAKPD